MPFTPFHFGPGAALKAASPGGISFTVFAFSQVLIDLEVVFFWAWTGDPVHPYLHTYLGALPVALLSIWPGRRICEWANRLWNSRLDEAQARWLSVPGTISPGAAAAGAFLGAYSHVLIDSLMHEDIRALRPFSEGGRMTGLISIEALQWLCVVLGIAGLAILFLRRKR